MDVELEGLAPTDEATRRIHELAESQHGVVARRQLLDMGMGRGLIQDRLDGRRLLTIHRGVYAVGHRRFDLPHRWIAAVLACGRRAVLSHGSAAHLWGLRGSYGAIEISRPSGGNRRKGILIHGYRHLPPAEVCIERGIPATTIERTLLDIATDLDERQLERALVDADRSTRLSWRAMGRICREGDGRMGIARLRKVTQLVDPNAVYSRSPQEVDFLALCREARLPPPQVNVLVEGHLIDFLWPEKRLVVESDSYGYHGDRPAFERDHQVTLELTAAGYKVLRSTYEILTKRPEMFMDQVRRSLEL
jgi:very-short-patch-repair endonuclease